MKFIFSFLLLLIPGSILLGTTVDNSILANIIVKILAALLILGFVKINAKKNPSM